MNTRDLTPIMRDIYDFVRQNPFSNIKALSEALDVRPEYFSMKKIKEGVAFSLLTETYPLDGAQKNEYGEYIPFLEKKAARDEMRKVALKANYSPESLEYFLTSQKGLGKLSEILRKKNNKIAGEKLMKKISHEKSKEKQYPVKTKVSPTTEEQNNFAKFLKNNVPPATIQGLGIVRKKEKDATIMVNIDIPSSSFVDICKGLEEIVQQNGGEIGIVSMMTNKKERMMEQGMNMNFGM